MLLRGGLGNQLFQYAAGYSLSKRQNSALVLNHSFLPNEHEVKSGVSQWPEEISSFNHEGILEAKTSTSIRRLAQMAYQAERFLGDAFGSRVTAIWGSAASELRSADGAYFSGKTIRRLNSYFAEASFFEDVASEITTQVVDIKNPSSFFMEQHSALKETNPAVVHVRLGDYKNLRHVYGELGPDYFRRARDLTVAHDPKLPIWVFSDEPEGAREVLGTVFPAAHYVAPPKEARPIESLVLMSMSGYKILSNSTFSWWAAFLGRETEKLTIFPRPLSAAARLKHEGTFLLKSWVQVGN